MSASRVAWGQVILVFAIMLLFWWAATEWTAWRLGFQPELGVPWFMLGHRWPVYAPPLFFWWWYEFDAYQRRRVRTNGRLFPPDSLSLGTGRNAASQGGDKTPECLKSLTLTFTHT